jgi:chloride channel 3/4/5
MVLTKGVLTGIVIYCIDIWVPVLFDWKEGYCTSITRRRVRLLTKDTGVWTRSFVAGDPKVCFQFFDAHIVEGNCPEWRTWSSMLPDTVDRDYVSHLIYIAFALTFAMVASSLTLLTKSVYTVPSEEGSPPVIKTMYFAAGSGEAEIKTILSGFVIRGYLGLRTLIIKGVGIIFSVASGLSLGKEGRSHYPNLSDPRSIHSYRMLHWKHHL